MEDDSTSLKEDIIALHQYWIYADRMRLSFYDKVFWQEMILFTLVPFEKFIKLFGINVSIRSLINISVRLRPASIYMQTWYGYLYVVIEGYKTLNLKDDEIDSLLKEYSDIFETKLRLFRNAIFHFQKKIDDPKINQMFDNDHEIDHVPILLKLHRKLGNFLVNHIKKYFSNKYGTENLLKVASLTSTAISKAKSETK